jgi:tetratricopeptide (TPR) repeat protein
MGLLVAIAAFSPLSPAALGPADAALGRGNPALAAARYDRIAAVHPLRSYRDEALYRAARVWSVDLDDPDQALERLHRLSRSVRTRDPERAAAVEAQIGHLQLSAKQDPVRAARAFDRAVSTAPLAAEAVAWRVAAARAWREAGELEAAERRWSVIESTHPERVGEAALALAELALTRGDAQAALGLYERAAHRLTDEVERGVAQLGIATCYERLGDLDEALAALDDADLPDPVRERRVQAVRARRDERRFTAPR